MSKQITIPFQVTGWDAVNYDETDDAPTLSRVMVKKSFDSDEFKGESVGTLLMCAAKSGAAGYTILDRFAVEISGRAGTFVAIHGGFTDDMKAQGRIVPDSGTGELAGISGRLEFKQDEGGKTIVFDYSLPE